MVHDRNKLLIDHMFSVNSINEVTMTLVKAKFDIWLNKRFLKSLVGFWKMCSLSIIYSSVKSNIKCF